MTARPVSLEMVARSTRINPITAPSEATVVSIHEDDPVSSGLSVPSRVLTDRDTPNGSFSFGSSGASGGKAWSGLKGETGAMTRGGCAGAVVGVAGGEKPRRLEDSPPGLL